MQVGQGEVLTIITHREDTRNPQLGHQLLHTSNHLQVHHKGIHLVGHHIRSLLCAQYCQQGNCHQVHTPHIIL